MSSPLDPTFHVEQSEAEDDASDDYGRYLQSQETFRFREAREARIAQRRREKIRERRSRMGAAERREVPTIGPADESFVEQATPDVVEDALAGSDIVQAADQAGVFETLGEPSKAVRGGAADLAGDSARFVDDIAAFIRGQYGMTPEEIEEARETVGLEQAIQPALDVIDPGPMRTPLGGMARDLLAWMLVARKAGQKMAETALAQKTGKAGQAAVQGFGGAAAADLITVEEGLAQTLREYPMLEHPVTDYLAAFEEGDEDTGAIEQRIRRTLVSGGFNLAADGLIQTLRWVGKVRRARRESPEAFELRAQDQPGAPEEAVLVSAPNAQAFSTTTPETRVRALERLRAAEERVAAVFPEGVDEDMLLARAAQLPEFTPTINWDRITDEASVQQALDASSRIFAESAQAARRGVVTDEAALRSVERAPVSMLEVLGLPLGTAMNKEQALGARVLLSSANNELDRLMKVAATVDASTADKFQARKMLAVHGAIFERVMGIRAEAGRGLQQWSMKVGGEIERAQMMRNVLDAAGGEELVTAIAKRYVRLAESGAPDAAINRFVATAAVKRTIREVDSAYRMNLLWGPATHAVNLMTPWLVLADAAVERRVAARFSEMAGRSTSTDPGAFVARGEDVALLAGGMAAFRDMLQLASRSAKMSGSPFDRLKSFRGEIESMRTEAGIPATDKIPEAAHPVTSVSGSPENQGYFRALDAIGSVLGIPGRALGFEDDMAKIFLHRAELHAQSVREAHRRLRTSGGEFSRDEVKALTDQILSDPPEHLRIEAVDTALEGTFTKPLPREGEVGMGFAPGRAMSQLSRLPIFGPMVFTYVRTPTNILRYGFERDPTLAMFVGQWRDDIAAGGARRDIASAKLAVGAVFTGVMMDLATSRTVTGTGSFDPRTRDRMKELGFVEGGMRIGDNYAQLNRLDTRARGAVTAATFVEYLEQHEIFEEDRPGVDEWIAGYAGALAAGGLSRTWLQGMSRFVDIVRNVEDLDFVTRRSVDMLTPLIPAVSALQAVRNVTDETIPQDMVTLERVDSVLEVLENRIPGLSSGNIRRRTVHGDPLSRDRVLGDGPIGALYDATSPVQLRKVKESPLDEFLAARGIPYPRINHRVNWGGIPVNFAKFPHVYDAYVQIAGGGEEIEMEPVKLMDQRSGAILPAKEWLTRQVRDKEFASGPRELQQAQFSQWIQGIRGMARVELETNTVQFDSPEFDAFRDYLRKERDLKSGFDLLQSAGERQRGIRVPTLGGNQ